MVSSGLIKKLNNFAKMPENLKPFDKIIIKNFHVD